MYTAFYGLREKPFALVPDPRFLYLSEAHREALAHLLYGIEQGEGFIAITGEVGTGKTTVCRTLLGRLGSETEVAFLFNPSRSPLELLQDIAAEFGLLSSGRSKSELTADLNRFLLEKNRDRRRVLLIIDEAQNLSAGTLEQVRLLSNLETASSKLIHILLLGQPELDRKLDGSELRQLRQRISVRWSLTPLSAAETRAYVRHRLHVAAGGERDIFTDAALREIYRRTGGVPRLVNVLSDRALLAGYTEGAGRIGPAIVRKAAREVPDARKGRMRFVRTPRRGGLRAFLGAGGLLGTALVAGLVFGTFAGGGAGPLAASLARLGWVEEPPVLELEAEAPVAQKPEPVRAPLGQAVAPPPAEPVLAATVRVDAPEPEPERPVSFLGALLGSGDPAAGRARAVNAILLAYGLEPVVAGLDDDGAALRALADEGLEVLPLVDTWVDPLVRLNHPALLSVVDAEGRQRLVALVRVEGDLAWLHGATGHGPVRVPIVELSPAWEGQAWVVWREQEPFERAIAYGEAGEPVVWLQTALADLGFYQGGAGGVFDRETRDALIEFQLERRLEPDGTVGPLTRMTLYDALERYELPRLDAAPSPDEWAASREGDQG